MASVLSQHSLESQSGGEGPAARSEDGGEQEAQRSFVADDRQMWRSTIDDRQMWRSTLDEALLRQKENGSSPAAALKAHGAPASLFRRQELRRMREDYAQQGLLASQALRQSPRQKPVRADHVRKDSVPFGDQDSASHSESRLLRFNQLMQNVDISWEIDRRSKKGEYFPRYNFPERNSFQEAIDQQQKLYDKVPGFGVYTLFHRKIKRLPKALLARNQVPFSKI